MSTAYEMVAGLEVHVELKTKTKIFCGCKTDFGAPPNTQCCPICMGLPGSLPRLNKKVIEYAIKAGLALNCSIAEKTYMDRKNYFYPDLPKGYQISQLDKPLCYDGFLDIGEKKIGITRIHIEEDTGKLIHKEKGTLIDCNRCGVPLIEIVSEPDIRSVSDAVAYLKLLRSVILYTGISDCRLNEGSFRCDVNLSVHKVGDSTFGTRTEIKNINSFNYVQRAMEYEFARQVSEMENGGEVVRETRRFDIKTGKTYSMRSKEGEADYRYFPEPDIPKFRIPKSLVEDLRKTLPELPAFRKERYMKKFGISLFEAEQLCQEVVIADFFDSASAITKHPKIMAGLILTEGFRLISGYIEKFPVNPKRLAVLADMQGEGKINSGTAKSIFAKLWVEDFDPVSYAENNNLLQESSVEVLLPVVLDVIRENPHVTEQYKSGKITASKALMGKIISRTGGRANPKVVLDVLEKELLKYISET